MEVTVKTLDSKSHKFENVDDSMTVKQFKERIASRVNVPHDKQRLIFRGKVLRDDQKLKDCNIEGKVLHLVERAPPPSVAQSSGQSTSSPSSQQHPHHHHFHRTSSSATSQTPPSVSSLGSLLGNLSGVPSDVVDMTQQIVQGLVGSFEHGGAQTEVTSASSADGRGVNVQINVNRAPVEIGKLRSNLDACRQAIGDIKRELDKKDGVEGSSSTTERHRHIGREFRHSRASTPAEVEAERLSIASDFSRLLLELADVSHRVEPHLREYANHLPHNSGLERPMSERLAEMGCTGRILQLMCRAYGSIRDIEGGLQDLLTIRDGRRDGQTGQQQERGAAREERRENTQSSSQESQGSTSQPQPQSQSTEASSSPQTTSSQPPSEYSHAVDALQRVMGTPVARMEIEMDQYEAPLQEVLAHGIRPPLSSERHSDRPSVEFMFNFIQHLPAGGERGEQEQTGSAGHSQLPAAFFHGLFPHIAVSRRAGNGGQDHQYSQQSASGRQEQGAGVSVQSQPSAGGGRPERESGETVEGEQSDATAGDVGGRDGEAPSLSVTPELFRTVSETLIRAVSSACSNPGEEQPSVHEVFSGLSDALGGRREHENTNMFGRLMDTVWNVLTAPEALTLFRGHVEPLQKLHSPFRQFVSQELLHGEPLTENNVEAALDCFFEGEEKAIDYVLSDCRVRLADVDLRATLLRSARRQLRRVLFVILRDYDISNGFAYALKEAFVSGVSELSYLASFGLEGGIDALHDTLRSRLVEVWDFPVAAEEFHQWSYQLCVGEYIDSAILQCPFTDEQVQQMVVWRDRMPQAVAVDGVECHAEERSGKSGNDDVPARKPFPLPQWLQSVPDGLPNVIVGSEEWHQSLPNQVISVVTRDIETQKKMPKQRAFSDGYTSCIPPKRRKASEIVSATVQQATGDTLRSAISAAEVTSSAAVEDIVQEARTHPGLSDMYNREFQLQLEERIASDGDFNADAFPNAAACFSQASRSRHN